MAVSRHCGGVRLPGLLRRSDHGVYLWKLSVRRDGPGGARRAVLLWEAGVVPGTSGDREIGGLYLGAFRDHILASVHMEGRAGKEKRQTAADGIGCPCAGADRGQLDGVLSADAAGDKDDDNGGQVCDDRRVWPFRIHGRLCEGVRKGVLYGAASQGAQLCRGSDTLCLLSADLCAGAIFCMEGKNGVSGQQAYPVVQRGQRRTVLRDHIPRAHHDLCHGDTVSGGERDDLVHRALRSAIYGGNAPVSVACVDGARRSPFCTAGQVPCGVWNDPLSDRAGSGDDTVAGSVRRTAWLPRRRAEE